MTNIRPVAGREDSGKGKLSRTVVFYLAVMLVFSIAPGGIIARRIMADADGQEYQVNGGAGAVYVFESEASGVTIAEIFPDDGLAAAVARYLGVTVNTEVTNAQLAGIEALDVGAGVSHVPIVGTLQGIEYLISLVELRINVSTYDISPLAGLVALEELRLIFHGPMSYVYDFSPLANLVNMRVLSLYGRVGRPNPPGGGYWALPPNMWIQISDLSPLAGMTKLESFTLINSHVEDLSPLAGMPNLETLYLPGNYRITDISALSGLMGLNYLNLLGSRIADISPLSELINLESLNLAGYRISDLSPLSGLINLRVLNIAGHWLSDISALEGLLNLEILNMPGNRISDISALSGLLSLEGLCLHGNHVSDISPLQGLASLEVLALGYNKIYDITYLSQLSRLRSACVTGNRITDISVLANLHNVEHFAAFDQTVTLAPLQRANPLVVENTIIGKTGNLLPPYHIQYSGGTYTSPYITWDGLADDAELVSFNFVFYYPDPDPDVRRITFTGTVTQPISNIIPGNVTGSGAVSAADVGMLRAYLAGFPVNIIREAADVNGDGQITAADVGLLRAYLAGFPVVLQAGNISS